MRNFIPSVLFLISCLFLLISCENSLLESINEKTILTNKTGVMEIKVDHYLSVAYGPFPGLYYITQEGEQIENNQWQIQYAPITNFNYEWGYQYRLLVNKQKNEPQMMDGSAFEYNVIDVLSKEKVDENEQFKIILKQYYDDGGSENFVEGDVKKGYSFLRKDFDCGKFCDELSEISKVDKTVLGIFKHSSDKQITLVGLESR